MKTSSITTTNREPAKRAAAVIAAGKVFSHHLDKRAAAIIAAGGGDPDDLLSTFQVAIWLGVSVQWLEIGRSKHYGPAYQRLSPRTIRYRRADVNRFLDERRHRGTDEYR